MFAEPRRRPSDCRAIVLEEKACVENHCPRHGTTRNIDFNREIAPFKLRQIEDITYWPDGTGGNARLRQDHFPFGRRARGKAVREFNLQRRVIGHAAVRIRKALIFQQVRSFQRGAKTLVLILLHCTDGDGIFLGRKGVSCRCQ